ncbi:cytochrome P460 family protein [Methanolobus halotolerans]|uniref:Cytochrome P460 domain-containing protein n=1 Tax=Methanolobus halotolerans TaxID=2052935 RepID=A0A4E0QYT1_9EURY|nr:cytochrome P460 family protein [Methanolobus halotolerans]TGC08904.1 hypothetical protein CUN85_07665 [Methanolobus halotolerans]
MKIGIMVFLLLLGIFLTTGCTDTQDADPDIGDADDQEVLPVEPEDVDSELPGPDGAEVFTYITEENNYRTWELWPLREEMYASTSIHGPLLTTYVSEDAESAIRNRAGSLPSGSMAVRESYDTDGELREIGVRYKVEGYDTEHRDWFWAAYTPEGDIIVDGRVESCQECHSVVADNDYVYTSYITDTPYREIDVDIRNYSFEPDSVNIYVGDTVTWTNRDSAVHTIDGGLFRSPPLGQGESFSYTFAREGRYSYMCTVHPYQTTGQIVVTG